MSHEDLGCERTGRKSCSPRHARAFMQRGGDDPPPPLATLRLPPPTVTKSPVCARLDLPPPTVLYPCTALPEASLADPPAMTEYGPDAALLCPTQGSPKAVRVLAARQGRARQGRGGLCHLAAADRTVLVLCGVALAAATEGVLARRVVLPAAADGRPGPARRVEVAPADRAVVPTRGVLRTHGCDQDAIRMGSGWDQDGAGAQPPGVVPSAPGGGVGRRTCRPPATTAYSPEQVFERPPVATPWVELTALSWPPATAL